MYPSQIGTLLFIYPILSDHMMYSVSNQGTFLEYCTTGLTIQLHIPYTPRFSTAQIFSINCNCCQMSLPLHKVHPSSIQLIGTDNHGIRDTLKPILIIIPYSCPREVWNPNIRFHWVSTFQSAPWEKSSALRIAPWEKSGNWQVKQQIIIFIVYFTLMKCKIRGSRNAAKEWTFVTK